MINRSPTEFRSHLLGFGLEPPMDIIPGEIHRFPGLGKKTGNTAAWCLLFDDERGGCFGDWSSDLSGTWHATNSVSYVITISEKEKQLRKSRRMQQRILWQQKQLAAATRADSIWNASVAVDVSYPYLLRKQVQPNIARFYKSSLVLPLTDFDGVLHSLQFIAESGEKRLLKGGRKRGCFIPVNPLRGDPARVVICEGWATGCSLVDNQPDALVIAAIDAGNLTEVAIRARLRWPNAEIIIAADDDRRRLDNPGLKKARAAAIASNALLVSPSWPADAPQDLTEFNDLAVWLGRGGAMSIDYLEQAKQPDEEWPDLVSLDVPELPRLDCDILSGWLGDFVKAISAATETPPELALGMALVSCATAVSRRCEVEVEQGYMETCNLWVVVALPPGNRKSAVQNAATRPLQRWEADRAKVMEVEINAALSERKTMEARANEYRKKAAKEGDDSKAKDFASKAAAIETKLVETPMVPQIWTSDATPERLGTMLSNHEECMAWLSSEGGIFDLLQGRYSNGIPNLDLVLKSHSGDAERVDRGSRPPVMLLKPRLSIGLSPQPDVLRGLASKPGFRGRGLIGRFIYFLPPSPLGYRTLKTTPVPVAVAEAYDRGIRRMLDWEVYETDDGPQLHTIKLSCDAYNEWFAFAKHTEKTMRSGESFEHATDWAGKAPGAAVRIAGVLHCVKHAHGEPWELEISKDTMEAALEIMAVASQHALAALGMMGADPTIAAACVVWDWIERGRRSHFTIREVFCALRGSFSRVKQLKEAIDALVERGYVEIIELPPSGAGRPPSPTVRVRPQLAERWR